MIEPSPYMHACGEDFRAEGRLPQIHMLALSSTGLTGAIWRASLANDWNIAALAHGTANRRAAQPIAVLKLPERNLGPASMLWGGPHPSGNTATVREHGIESLHSTGLYPPRPVPLSTTRRMAAGLWHITTVCLQMTLLLCSANMLIGEIIDCGNATESNATLLLKLVRGADRRFALGSEVIRA
ncbi:hypothetical protein CHU98_g8811 [Xylaria longipes]|nr:hypothetical protein CHU98_g8811 [Xylaria longipes]